MGLHESGEIDLDLLLFGGPDIDSTEPEEILCQCGRGRGLPRMVPRLPQAAILHRISLMESSSSGLDEEPVSKLRDNASSSSSTGSRRGRGRARILRENVTASSSLPTVGRSKLTEDVPSVHREGPALVPQKPSVPQKPQNKYGAHWLDSDFPSLQDVNQNNYSDTSLKPRVPRRKPHFMEIREQLAVLKPEIEDCTIDNEDVQHKEIQEETAVLNPEIKEGTIDNEDITHNDVQTFEHNILDEAESSDLKLYTRDEDFVQEPKINQRNFVAQSKLEFQKMIPKQYRCRKKDIPRFRMNNFCFNEEEPEYCRYEVTREDIRKHIEKASKVPDTVKGRVSDWLSKMDAYLASPNDEAESKPVNTQAYDTVQPELTNNQTQNLADSTSLRNTELTSAIRSKNSTDSTCSENKINTKSAKEKPRPVNTQMYDTVQPELTYDEFQNLTVSTSLRNKIYTELTSAVQSKKLTDCTGSENKVNTKNAIVTPEVPDEKFQNTKEDLCSDHLINPECEIPHQNIKNYSYSDTVPNKKNESLSSELPNDPPEYSGGSFGNSDDKISLHLLDDTYLDTVSYEVNDIAAEVPNNPSQNLPSDTSLENMINLENTYLLNDQVANDEELFDNVENIRNGSMETAAADSEERSNWSVMNDLNLGPDYGASSHQVSSQMDTSNIYISDDDSNYILETAGAVTDNEITQSLNIVQNGGVEETYIAVKHKVNNNSVDKHKHKSKTSQITPTENSWRVNGNGVIQVDGLPKNCVLSNLEEMVSNFGTVSDCEKRVVGDRLSIRFRLHDEDACDFAVQCLHDTDCLFPDSNSVLECFKVS